MPGITPVFGLPYPLASDPVDPSAFADLAGAIDAAMASVEIERNALLKKPMLSVSHFTNPALGPATDQILGWDLIAYDTSGMAPAIGGTDLTCRVPGVYTFEIDGFQAFGYATWVGEVVSFDVNGIQRLVSSKKPQTTATGGQSPLTNVQMVWPLVAGDVVRVRWAWGGTGTVTSLFVNVNAVLLCPLV